MYYSGGFSSPHLEADGCMGGGVFLGGCTTTGTTSSASSVAQSAWSGGPSVSSLAQGCLPTAWAHTVPTSMPWGNRTAQEVVRFSAPGQPCTSQTATTWELMHDLGGAPWGVSSPPKRQLKRHAETPQVRPLKQLITEEKMVAHMSGLSLECPMEAPSPEEMASTSPVDGSQGAGLIVLSPELQEYVDNDQLISKSIVDDMRKRACMALVLWQPSLIPSESQEPESSENVTKSPSTDTAPPSDSPEGEDSMEL